MNAEIIDYNSAFFSGVSEIRKSELRRWLRNAPEIQWDYKDIVKRKGRQERLK